MELSLALTRFHRQLFHFSKKILFNFTIGQMKAKPLIIYPFFCLALLLFTAAHSQQTSPYGIEVNPISVEGAPIRSVVILLEKEGKEYVADTVETGAFYKAFGLKPGALFKPDFADLAIQVILKQPEIKEAYYRVYNSEIAGPVTMVVHATFLGPGELKTVDGRKGMSVAGGMKAFPLILQTENSKLTFIFNGAVGSYNEVNGLFAQGAAFTQGNPIATNPAGEGTRYWSEAYIEPGIAGITRLGKSKLYPYGSISYLISGRNTSDIYSDGGATYGAFERLYGGFLLPKLGKNQNLNIEVSAGRQFYQLNDGFLFSRFSGSSNAGERGSVYLNSRTTYQMSVFAKAHIKNFVVQGVFLEPQELFKTSQRDTRFLIGSFNYNNNKHVDVGISYITIGSSKATYGTPQGTISKEGMYIINPKLWFRNIAETGLFLKSEYAFQSHSTADMQSNAWYAGLGIHKPKWRYSPSFYYRYAFMKGDDASTARYERFDPIQTGGLGNWVQGINFRKVTGSGNFVTHRVELKGYLTRNFEVTVDYFFLQADDISTNIGSLPPISNLLGKTYGHEVTINPRYFLSRNFFLLGVFSWAIPGDAIEKAFNEQGVYAWSSYQLSAFMFF